MIWVPANIGDVWVFEITTGTQYRGVPEPEYGGQPVFEDVVTVSVTVLPFFVTVTVTVLVDELIIPELEAGPVVMVL
jgi:hypothetical protein